MKLLRLLSKYLSFAELKKPTLCNFQKNRPIQVDTKQLVQ